MINIYCLIDPRNNKPFYVGATKHKVNIRLSGHINEAKSYLPKHWSDKQKLINELLSEGKKPRTRLLKTVGLSYYFQNVDNFVYENCTNIKT